MTLLVDSGPSPGFNQGNGSAANALLDNYGVSSSPYTVTLSGLQASSPYDLVIYGNNGYYNVANDSNTLYAVFTITAGTTAANGKQTSNTSIATSNNYNRAEDYIAYAAFNGAQITSSASWTIAFTVSNEGALTSNVFNGLQLTGTFATVPEPNTLALAGPAVCGFLIRRTRRAR